MIAEWLKTKVLRIVQYMACLSKYVSSTERYNVFNMQELKDALDRYHPLSKLNLEVAKCDLKIEKELNLNYE